MTEGKTEKRKDLLIYLPNSSNGQGRSSLNPEVGTICKSPTWVAGAQVLGPSFTAFSVALAVMPDQIQHSDMGC